MNHRHDLTDAHWTRLAPLLPPQQPEGGGKPNADHRMVLNGIRWRLRTGAPWRDVPQCYGPWATIYSRFRRWQQAGIWERVLTALIAAGNAAGDLEWSLQYLDGTVIRAHAHAAGAKKGAVIRPSAAAKAAFRPKSTSGPKAVANRSPGQ
jgi:transposase